MIRLGNIYWLKINSEFKHPHVVVLIEENTATLCAITTNLKKVNMPGNVQLNIGEGNLDKISIVEVSKEIVVNQSELTEYLGQLSSKRVEEIINGIGFLKRSFL